MNICWRKTEVTSIREVMAWRVCGCYLRVQLQSVLKWTIIHFRIKIYRYTNTLRDRKGAWIFGDGIMPKINDVPRLISNYTYNIET